MIEDNGDPYNPASAAYIGQRACEAEAKADTGRKLDPELRVIGFILRQLDDLDERSRARVVAYLSDRYLVLP